MEKFKGSTDLELRKMIERVHELHSEIRMIYCTYSFAKIYYDQVRHSIEEERKFSLENESIGGSMYGIITTIIPCSGDDPPMFWMTISRDDSARYFSCGKTVYVGKCDCIKGHPGQCVPVMKFNFTPLNPVHITRESCVKLGGHCWEESPEVKQVGKKDSLEFRHCIHCGVREKKEWKESRGVEE